MKFLNKYKTHLRSDAIAGITVALILVPQSLAYAQLAGLPPITGLYASLLPPLVAAFFGSSSQLSTGPVAVLSLMTAGALAPLADAGSAEYISLAIFLALGSGVFQLLMGAFRLGSVVSFLSHPVVYGFTNAAAIIIGTTQLAPLFGVVAPKADHQYQIVWEVLQLAVARPHLPTVICGFLALGIVVLLRRISKKIPATLIVIVLSAVVSKYAGYTGSIVGAVPAGLPQLVFPDMDAAKLSELFLAMVTMSILGFTEGVSIAQAIAVKTKQRLDASRELIGQGLANLVSGISQGYPVAGSFSRTAVNFQSGAQTWLASLITSVIVLIILLFFTPLLFYIPKAVLAAIIIMAVSGLVDFSKFADIWKASKADVLVALITFLTTLYFAPELDIGIGIGVLLSMAYFIYRSTHPRISFLSRYKDKYLHDAATYHLDRCENVAVVRLDAPLFFANATFFEDAIIKDLAENKHITDVLIVATGINDVDATGVEMLESLVDEMKAARKELYFSGIKAPVMEVFTNVGLRSQVGDSHFFPTTASAMEYILRHVLKSHSHADAGHCPLIKYVRIPVRRMERQRRIREKVAHYYEKFSTTVGL